MDIAKCVRIFDPDPADDFVAKREAAIRDLRSRFLKKPNVAGLMRLVSEVSVVFGDSPKSPASITENIEAAIKKQSVSFVRDGRDLEMCVCAATALVAVIESGTRARSSFNIPDVLAVAMWSGASFLPPCTEPKLEEFRSQAIDIARSRILKAGLEKRVRKQIQDFGRFGDDNFTHKAFEQATKPTVHALTDNAALDREEIDVLWWVLAGTSEILKRPLSSLSPECRAVATGIELGALMRRLPSQSHRNLSMRGIDEGNPLPLTKLLDGLGDDRSPIAATFANESLIDHAPSVFPLLWAIRTGDGTMNGADLARSMREWCARALLERAVLRIQYEGQRKI